MFQSCAPAAPIFKNYMIKYLILSCLTAVALISLAGCASDEKQSSTTESSAATMSTDTKAMNNPSNSNTH
jgi:hypothetical protein